MERKLAIRVIGSAFVASGLLGLLEIVTRLG